jgi:hypothetical protein
VEDQSAVESMAPAFEDLVRTCPVPATIVDEPWSELGPSLMMLAPDGSGMGIWVDVAQPRADQVAQVADQVQEWAVEALWGAGRSAIWPECPTHPASHPLKATVIDVEPVWICPVDETTQSTIGGLHQPT